MDTNTLFYNANNFSQQTHFLNDFNMLCHMNACIVALANGWLPEVHVAISGAHAVPL